MKTVLVVTGNPTHRLLYETGLQRYFAVEFSGKGTKVDAVVYDLPGGVSTIDFRWLKNLDIPVVILSPEEGLRVLQNPRRRVLTYPVRLDRIVQALADLGVTPEGGLLVP